MVKSFKNKKIGIKHLAAKFLVFTMSRFYARQYFSGLQLHFDQRFNFWGLLIATWVYVTSTRFHTLQPIFPSHISNPFASKIPTRSFKRFILAVTGPSYCFRKDPFIFSILPHEYDDAALRVDTAKIEWRNLGRTLAEHLSQDGLHQNTTKYKIWQRKCDKVRYSKFDHSCATKAILFIAAGGWFPEQARLSIRIFVQHTFFLPPIFKRTCGIYVAEHKTKNGIGVGLGGSGWVADERWPSKDQCCSSNRDSAFVRIVPFAGTLVVLYGCHCVLARSRNKAILNGRRHTYVSISLWSVPRSRTTFMRISVEGQRISFDVTCSPLGAQEGETQSFRFIFIQTAKKSS